MASLIVQLVVLANHVRIMADLDPTAQKLLSKDPNNPNSPKKGEPARPGLGLSKSTMTGSKPSLRETLMAQKKATMAAKSLPARPGSAMAHISPVRTASNTSTSSTSSNPSTASTKPATRTRPDTISVNASGMSVAPMRPTRRRPEVAARPATAGPYSVRDLPASMEADSPRSLKSKAIAPRPRDATTPKRPVSRVRPGHAAHASESSVVSPHARPASRIAVSPKESPSRLRQAQSALSSTSPSKHNDDATLVVPSLSDLGPHQRQHEEAIAESQPELVSAAVPTVPEITLETQPETLSEPLKVFEDASSQESSTRRPTFTGPVLEDRPVNEDAASLQRSNGQDIEPEGPESPEKARQNARLLDSGIAKIKAKSLEVHGFRKLQSLLRDSKTVFTDEKFEALLMGLFQFLEDPLEGLGPSKSQDVKAQILATIKLLLKKDRDNFQPYISKGLESLLQTRSTYDSRAHIVSALELLADELATIGDGAEMVVVLARRLQGCPDTAAEGCRMLSMGLHVLKEMLDKRPEMRPAGGELAQLAALAGRCLDSADSGVRMDAVQLCVALHARVPEQTFWDAIKGVKDDPKSLITYYIVKRQRDQGGAVAV